MIRIKGRKAEVLAALFNASHAQGMSFLSFNTETMTIAKAEALLRRQSYFDYLEGRIMKCDFSGDSLDERLYERDCGVGSAAAALRDAGLEP